MLYVKSYEGIEVMISYINGLRLSDKFLFGTKAAALGELIYNNIIVPKGFALSAEVFDDFLEYNAFPFSISDYPVRNDEIRRFILNSSFSDTALCELKKYYLTIKNSCKEIRFAVRSSSLCEDTKNFSMAGMFDSYINLYSFEEIIDAIKKCYASLFQDKVLAFVINNNMDMKELRMGVIIQEFMEGDLSGVNFSADITQMDSEIACINIVSGICENYVSGKMPSALYKLDKKNGKVISRTAEAGLSKISNEVLEKLFYKTLELEKIFGCFQDIEWTLANDEIYILQSRPITTFKNRLFNLTWKDAEDENYEWWIGPPIPFPTIVLDICAVEEAAFSVGAYNTGYAERYMARTIQNGYIYFRKRAFPHAEERKKEFMKGVNELADKGMNIFQDLLQPKLDELICNLNKYFNRKLSNKEHVEFLDLALKYFKTATSFHWPAQMELGYIGEFKEYCNNIFDKLSERDYYDLIYKRSIVTKERELLFEMAQIVKADKVLWNLFDICPYDELLFLKLKNCDKSSKLLNSIENYLQYFGVCDAGYGGYIPPVLFERPEGVIMKVRSLLQVSSENFYRSIDFIEKNKKKVLSDILEKLSNDEYEEFYKRLKTAEKAFLVTDTHNYYIERQAWGYLRIAIMKAASTLKDEDILKEVQDVFYFNFQELKTAVLTGDIDYGLIAERKKLLEQQKKLLPPNNIGKISSKQKDGINDNLDSTDLLADLKGVSTFNGMVQGRIVKGIPHNIDEDSILVVSQGHCGDITYLLKRVKGLIFENGSPFDHLGIISREMNIPAIYYVKNALSILQEGDIVEIDGTKGLIRKDT